MERVDDVVLDDRAERPEAVVRRDVGLVAPDVCEEPVANKNRLRVGCKIVVGSVC